MDAVAVQNIPPIVVSPFIEGCLQPSQSAESFWLNNPATGQRSIEQPVGSEEDVERAVTSSRAAFEDGRWCGLAPSKRSSILHKFADLIEAEASQLDALDALDMGKPLSLTFGNAASSAGAVRYCTDTVGTITGDLYHSDKHCRVIQERVPRGVVSAITPWNFPALSAIGKLAPALATGNSVVLKPSENSPQSAMRLAQLAIDAGIPPGVFNLVPGKGEIVGRALALHNEVDMVAFTGSTGVGKLMLQYAGQSNLKLVQAECGGKSPQIVFADFEDLDTVVDSVAQSILTNQGQICVAGSRLLVQKDIEVPLIEKVAERLKNIRAGDPLDQNTTYGPLVNQTQMERVLSYIDAGTQSASLVCGGGRILQDSGGYFVEPTLFSGVDSQAKIAQEEIFGPVLSVTSFTDTEDAIRLANSTKYGLAAYAWTTNLSTGIRLSKGIHAGMVTINSSAIRGECSASRSVEPYGLSGVGVEHGKAGLETYLRRQVTWFNHGAGNPHL